MKSWKDKSHYVQLVERSNFTFAPRGLGPATYRMYEVRLDGLITEDSLCADCRPAFGLTSRIHPNADCPPSSSSLCACVCVQALQLGTVPIYVW